MRLRAMPPPHSSRLSSILAAAERPLIRRRLFWFAAFVIVASGLRAGLVFGYMRSQAIASSERLTASLAQVIAEQTTRTFQNIDLRLQLAAADLRELEAAGELTPKAAGELLRAEMRDLPFVRALSVADARGRVIYSSDPGSVGADVTDRLYFQIYRTTPDTEFFIGPPIRGRSAGAWLISAARPWRSTPGAFGGIIVAAAEPPYFDQLWRSVDLGPGGSIALFRRDGTLMLRSPFDEAAMGRNFSNLPTFQSGLQRSPAGTFQTVSAFDGIRRIFGYRTLPTRPELIVVVGQSYDLILAPWRQFVRSAVSIWAAASVIVILFGAFLNRAWQQRLRTEAQVERMAQRLSLATNAASIGVWDWDLVTDRWAATPTYFSMLGYEPEEEPGQRQRWTDRLHEEDRDRVDAIVQKALAGADAPYQHEARIRHADGSFRWVSVIGRVLERDAGGRPARLLGVMIDVTETKRVEEALRSSLREKEALLKEVHHRVKNNLQVITSLLRLETGRCAEPATKAVLKDMQSRIRSMALLHEALYRTGVFARVDLAPYLRNLTTQLFRAQKPSSGSVALRLDLAEAHVGIDQAIPCGLIVNELVSNSLKHAFPAGRDGEVAIDLRQGADGRVHLRVSDTGVGLGQDFAEKRAASLGLQLVADLARQIGGVLEIGEAPSAWFAIHFLPPGQGDVPPVPADSAA